MSKENKIQSLEIGLNILEIIATYNKPLKFSEIQNITSMTKSNLHKYLTTLHEFGAIQRNPDNTYSLGHKLIQLGNLAQGQTSIVEVVIPYLKKSARKPVLPPYLRCHPSAVLWFPIFQTHYMELTSVRKLEQTCLYIHLPESFLLPSIMNWSKNGLIPKWKN